MENLRIFENPEFGQVRTKLDDKGEAWFIASDIAKVLGYRDSNCMTRNLDIDEKGTQNVRTLGGNQTMTIINESGLYHAILLSRLVSAMKFRKWVTGVVLPQIRKTGGFIPLGDGDTEEEITAKTIDIMQKTIAQKEALIEKQKPDVMFSKAIQVCDNDIRPL